MVSVSGTCHAYKTTAYISMTLQAQWPKQRDEHPTYTLEVHDILYLYL